MPPASNQSGPEWGGRSEDPCGDPGRGQPMPDVHPGPDRERAGYNRPSAEANTRLELEKLARLVGTTPHALGRLLTRCGPLQRWVLERLMTDGDPGPRPPWITITELAAKHVGGRPSRRQVQALRNACARLARVGLVETSQRWVERQEERRDPISLRRETTTRRRHLCIRMMYRGRNADLL